MFVGAHFVSALAVSIFLTDVFGTFSFIALMVGLLPTYIIIHLFRKINREKHDMIAALQTFNLCDAECRLDFDREFIRSAIRSWYGSERAFEDFVRNILRAELLSIASANNIPAPYIAMVCAAGVTSSLDCIASLLNGGAPAEVVLTHFIGYSVANASFWFFSCLNLILYLADRWALPLCSSIGKLTWLNMASFQTFLPCTDLQVLCLFVSNALEVLAKLRYGLRTYDQPTDLCGVLCG